MASRLVPILLGTGVLAVILLSGSKSKAATPTKPAETKPKPSGGFTIRPLNKTNLPAGTQIARVAPACDAQDRIAFPGCDNGLLLHSAPDASKATLVAPPGLEHPEHPRTGEEIGILPGRESIPELNMPGSALNRWAEVIGAGGFRGFVRVTDSKGRRNITPTTEVIGGGAPPEGERPDVGAWPGHGMGYGHRYAWRHGLSEDQELARAVHEWTGFPGTREQIANAIIRQAASRGLTVGQLRHLQHRGGLDHAALQNLATAQRARVSAVGPFFTEEDRARMVRRMMRESRRVA